ncbi:hypothetical protein GWI33_019097 [Rhynchophorus ferrugineus]|uniref:Uncharacterized protein n=1 Tax=Rhynchophorus ferrugineus TaxID=354439 RepID=A0A834HS44_RHYFE|nr:hypothetical protein GWI33_019097 [Rhynchophorus ferrugineus]
MGLWHGVEYYEKEKQVGEEFYQQWSTLLQDNSTIYYDWGFALGWLGVFSCLGGSLLFFFGSCCLQAEKDREQLDNVQYIVPAWAGVGWSLVAAILFSGSAVCLRGEREREEAVNMQYLMPVYPQKQQYAYAGYPVPPQPYSGPYYTTGSAYGPYNY